MKIFRKLTMIILSVCMFVPYLAVNAEQNTNIIESRESFALKEDAEYLYKKINDFLLEYKDVSPEKFDDICKEYMTKNTTTVKLLSEKDFEEKSKDSIVLYRGITEKQFADNLKKGIIYMPSNIKNVRGMGIYATTSLECAKRYSDKTDPKTVVKMLMPKTGVKVLEDEYLEKLKEIIRRTHPENFGMFSANNKENCIFDSAAELLNEKFGEVFQKIEREQIEDPDEQYRLFNEVGEQLKKHPIMINRKRYFKENKASVFYNSGLLCKLLGFDVLHSTDYLSDNTEIKEEEYLIVEPKVLSVLND